MNQQRIPAGRKMTNDVVATDAIALLSGVNFGSVIKVLAAVEALRLHTGIAVEDIVKFANVPIEPVQFDGSCEDRVVATDKLAHDIVRDRKIDFLDYVLRLKRRLGAATL